MTDDRLGIDRQILSIEFAADAVAVTYFTVPDDLRSTGLQQSHRLVIPMDTDEYSLELVAVHEAIQALVNDAIEDLHNLEPYDPAALDDDDEDDDGDG